MKISDILIEKAPQGTVKPVPSAVVNSPSTPAATPAVSPATTPKKMNVDQAQQEYDDIEDEEQVSAGSLKPKDDKPKDNPGSKIQ